MIKINNINILELIKQKYPRLSKSQKLIADYIEHNTYKAINLTALELAEEISISESTVVRFAQELEFIGFPEFISQLLEEQKPLLTKDQKLELLKKNIDKDNPVEHLKKHIVDSIDKNFKDLATNNIDKLIDMIFKADRIYLYGNKFLVQYISCELTNMGLVTIDLNVFDMELVKSAKNNDLVLCIGNESNDVYFNSLCSEVSCNKFLITDNYCRDTVDFEDRIVLNRNVDDVAGVSADVLSVVNLVLGMVRFG